MKSLISQSIDFKSLIIGMLTVLLGFSFYGSSKNPLDNNIIKAKSLIIVDDNGNEVLELSASKNGGVLRILNSSGKTTGVLGTNDGGNGQLIVLDKNENPMVFVGTAKDKTGLVRTYLRKDKISTELGKGFLYTFNSSGKITGYFGTSSDSNGIIKTFDKNGSQDSFLGNSYLRFYNDSGQTTCYLGTAEDEGGMITLTDKDGKEIFSK